MQSVTYYFTFWKNVILLQLLITYYFFALRTLKKKGFVHSTPYKLILTVWISHKKKNNNHCGNFFFITKILDFKILAPLLGKTCPPPLENSLATPLFCHQFTWPHYHNFLSLYVSGYLSTCHAVYLLICLWPIYL